MTASIHLFPLSSSTSLSIETSASRIRLAQSSSLTDTTRKTIVYKCDNSGYTAAWQSKAYFAYLTLTLFVIPVCIMIYCYAGIVRVVWLRAGALAPRNIGEPRVQFVTNRCRSGAASDPAVCLAQVGSAEHLQPSAHRLPCRHSSPRRTATIGLPRRVTLMTKRSVIRMAMSVTVGFLVCWTPFFVVTSVRVYSDYRYQWTAAKPVSGIAAISHSVVNPVLFIICSWRAVRGAFVRLCQRAVPRR